VWESEVSCVVCFSRVCYFRRVISFTYSLYILGDLPMKLVNVYSSGDRSLTLFPFFFEMTYQRAVKSRKNMKFAECL